MSILHVLELWRYIFCCKVSISDQVQAHTLLCLNCKWILSIEWVSIAIHICVGVFSAVCFRHREKMKKLHMENLGFQFDTAIVSNLTRLAGSKVFIVFLGMMILTLSLNYIKQNRLKGTLQLDTTFLEEEGSIRWIWHTVG